MINQSKLYQVLCGHILWNYIAKVEKSECVINNIKIFATVLVKAALLLINKAVEADIKTVDEELMVVLPSG